MIEHPDGRGPYFELICCGKTYEMTALVSPEDYEWAKDRGNWFVTHAIHKKWKTMYPVRSEGGRLIWLHKEVLMRAVGPHSDPRYHIGDHMNGNKMDARRGNLRWATFQMNARNVHGIITRQFELPL